MSVEGDIAPAASAPVFGLLQLPRVPRLGDNFPVPSLFFLAVPGGEWSWGAVGIGARVPLPSSFGCM